MLLHTTVHVSIHLHHFHIFILMHMWVELGLDDILYIYTLGKPVQVLVNWVESRV